MGICRLHTGYAVCSVVVPEAPAISGRNGDEGHVVSSAKRDWICSKSKLESAQPSDSSHRKTYLLLIALVHRWIRLAGLHLHSLITLVSQPSTTSSTLRPNLRITRRLNNLDSPVPREVPRRAVQAHRDLPKSLCLKTSTRYELSQTS